MGLTQVHKIIITKRMPNGWEPDFFELNLGNHQRVISVKWSAHDRWSTRRKTTDWTGEVWIESRL